ncbi:MAG: aldose epimerase family protein [Balneolaceae bacterium]
MADGVEFPVAEHFETEIDGKQVGLYTLKNSNGLRTDITNHGGKIVSLFVPDKNAIFEDIVTGYHTIDDFIESEEVYFGAIIGRYGNRIGNARFEIDSEEYVLDANNGPNHLHGGPGGFHRVVWDAEQPDDQTLILSYLSPHLEEGYPGNLQAEVIYKLNDNNELVITYRAETDQPTHVNLTNHAFFNLAGEGSSSINNHYLKVNADHFTPVDESLIPTGEIQSVNGTPLDFREYHQIGDRVNSDHQQMIFGNGYDHNFVLNQPAISDEMIFAASVYEPESRRQMDVFTTEPGIQFYGGNFLTGNEIGKRGEPYLRRTSFCLETQHFPDTPNRPEFPSTLLTPGEEYSSKTIYRFSIKE